MKKYIYTVFVKGGIYWKSFTNKAKAQKEATRLRKDGAKKVSIRKQED